jgi:hypothetical protein
VGLSEVSEILWQERQLLELLLFKLEEEQLVLSSGRTRWVTHATREVELVLEEINRAEVARAVEVDATAAEIGLPAGPSLHQLVEAADAPWRGILEQHRSAFRTITQEILALAQVSGDALTRGERGTEEALAWLGDSDAPISAPPSDATSETPETPPLVNEAR